MKVLAIESSTHRGTVAIADEEKTLAERSITKNAEELPLCIDEILKETSSQKSEIGLIAVSSGPGFFTPLKVGAAVAKSFAYALNLPIAPVPSLEILAASADCPPDCVVCGAIDARSGMFFWALFKKQGDEMTRLSEDTVTKPQELQKRLDEITETPLIAVLQEGSPSFGDVILPSPEFKIQPSKASICAKLGLRLMKKGKTGTAFSFVPQYARDDLYT